MHFVSRNHSLVFYISCTLGMALLWIVLRGQMYASVFSATAANTTAGQWNYYFFIAVMCVLSIVAVIARKPLELDLLAKPGFIMAAAIMGTVAVAVMYIIGGDESSLHPLYLVGVLVLALSTIVLLLSWGVMIADIDVTTGILCNIFGCSLSFIHYILPGVANEILLISGPILVGLFRCICRVPARSEVDETFSSLKRLPIALIVVLVLFLIFGSMIRGILYSGSVRHPDDFGLLEDTVSIICSLLLFAIVLISKWNRRTSLIIWLLLSILFFAGLFAVALLGPNGEGIAKAIVIPARTLLGFFLWLVLVIETGNKKTSTLLAVIIIYLWVELLSAAVTYVIMPFFASQLSALFGDYTTAMAMVVAFMLVVGSLLFLGNISIKREGDAKDGEKVDDKRDIQNVSELEICKELAPLYGLTPRETEIMALIAQGNSLKKMAEILVLSPTTIQSHSRSLYNKLDIHDRQKIIDLVNGQRNKSTSERSSDIL